MEGKSYADLLKMVRGTVNPSDGGTLLVKMEGKSYADLLKMVRGTVNPSDGGVDIRDIRKTKEEEFFRKEWNR
ncbi:hypothetical protein QE152_g38839 [Popillia japonica]|uniref:Uncharacterized protein n=1 Tax=Popillia japonica TaxID=7064 RepID=A0AAW1HWG5_POPJA